MNQDHLLTVGILIFDDVEVLDFCGPFEAFKEVGFVEVLRRSENRPIMRYFIEEQ